MLWIKFTSTSYDTFHVNARENLWWLVNLGSGNGLVSLDNKQSAELMLTQTYITLEHP